MRSLFTVALVFLPMISGAAGKRPITHEDLWLMPRVGAPATSPDGQWAVFPLIEPSYVKEEQTGDLWIVPTDGREGPRRITSGKGGETDPVWSPDSRSLAFSAKRGDDKEAQIYVIDLARGGEAQRATRISTGATTPRYSPDGTRLLYSSIVPTQSRNDADSQRLAKEEEEKKYKVRAYSTYPIRLWDAWLEDKQLRLFVQRIGEQDGNDILAGSKLSAGPGFALTEKSAQWSPDGKSIVFAATRNNDRSAWSFTHADLWMVPAQGGEPRRLTGADSMEAGDSWGAPRFSRDGSLMFAMVEPRTSNVYNAHRIAIFDWPSMRERGRVTLPDAREIADYAIAPDSNSVFVLGGDAGQVKLYRASTKGGTAELYGSLVKGVYSDMSIGGARSPVLIAAYQSATEPPEIVSIDPGGQGFRALSAFTPSRVANLDLQPVENFWFTNQRGQRIHSMLIRPPGFNPRAKYPLLVLIHGGPYSQWHDEWVLRWNYHLLSAQGYVLLLTNYMGSTSNGEAFAQSIQGDPLKGPTDDVNQAADEAIKRFAFIDAGRQCAAGASYGGHMANWLQGTTTRYSCLISHAGLVNLESQWGTSDVSYGREIALGGPVWEQGDAWREQNPIRLAANFKTPVLVTFGEKDFRVPLNNGLEYWTALQRQQVESRLVVFPEENHWILSGENSKYFYKEVGDWLAKYLGKTGSATPKAPPAEAPAEAK